MEELDNTGKAIKGTAAKVSANKAQEETKTKKEKK